jgi:hypothetical protein
LRTDEQNAANGKYFSFVADLNAAYCALGALVFSLIEEYHHAVSQICPGVRDDRRNVSRHIECKPAKGSAECLRARIRIQHRRPGLGCAGFQI